MERCTNEQGACDASAGGVLMTMYRRLDEKGIPQIAEGEAQGFRARMAFAFADHMILANTQGSAMGDALGRMDAQPHEHPAPDAHLMPIPVIVKRACDLADALYAEMYRREFIVDVPPADPSWERIE